MPFFTTTQISRPTLYSQAHAPFLSTGEQESEILEATNSYTKGGKTTLHSAAAMHTGGHSPMAYTVTERLKQCNTQ